MINFNTGNSTWQLEGNTQTHSGAVDVTGGRVSIFDFSGTVLEISDDPQGGHVTINPDGTVALVMTNPNQSGNTSFDVKVATSRGTETITVNLDVEKSALSGGWGEGDHYMLATDDGGKTIVEPGENHRKVYVTNASDGLSVSDIARREGLSVDKITAKWLVEEQSKYGATEGLALDQEAASRLWYGLTEGLADNDAEPGSHWLMLESGYSYGSLGQIIGRGAKGESELHPLLVTSWGTGDNPVINSTIKGFQEVFKNFAMIDVDIGSGLLLLDGENVLIDGTNTSGNELNIQYMDGITIRGSTIVDAVHKEANNARTWDGALDRKSGLFIKDSDGVLVEDTLADHNGWAEGYDYNLSADAPQPPSNQSHNYYFQKDVSDLTFRDNVSINSASTGAQVRAGGLVEGNAFIGNSVGVLLGSGVDNTGNYSLMLDNVTTLSGWNLVQKWQGYLGVGLDNKAVDSSLVGNIITHLTDPTDRAAFNSRTEQPAFATLEEFEPLVDDTIIYNWSTIKKPRGNTNQPDNRSASQLNDTTVKSFVEDVLNRNAGTDGLDALSSWLRGVWNSDTLEAKRLVDYFQKGFGIDIQDRSAGTNVRFTPNEASDGVRWDVRLNWSTEDVPIDGDSVDLGGNWVRYSGTTSLNSLDLGDRGALTVTQGLLETNSFTAGSDATLSIGGAGQFWTNGYSGSALDITIDGGRFANTGAFKSTGTVSVSDGEVLFGTEGGNFILDGRLDIVGADAKLGFDGNGSNGQLTLDDDAILAFKARGGDVASIDEFRSGHWGTAAPNVTSLVDLGDGSAELELSGISGSSRQILIDADQIKGGFGEIDVTGSKLSINLDYSNDRLDVAAVSSSGTSILNQFGSSAQDVFYVANGVQNLISSYQDNDIVDLSAKLNTSDEVTLQSTSSGDLLLNSGGTLLARITPISDNGGVRIGIDDRNWLLSPDGTVVDDTQDPVDDTPVPVDDAPDTPDPNGTLIGMGLTEVETLDLAGYAVETRTAASGGSGIKALDSGTASGVFNGADGTYMIEVGYFNENDGVSEWELLVDGEVVNTWTGAGGNNALETISIEADLAQGDEIMLQGLRDSGEFARLDWIDITSQDPVDDTPVPVDDAPDTPDPNGTLIGMGLTEVETLDLAGYAVETRPAASGGSGIKTLDSGTASGIFSGADGTYMIEVGYLNENDGVSEWELLVDGEVVNTWTGAGGNNALETISIEADLAQGDEIMLQGLRDSGEFARLDWIDITSQDPVDDTPVPVDDAPDTPDPNGTLIGMGLTEVETLDLAGYAVETRPAASGGSGIKTLDSGTASGVFNGADGTYMIEVGYLNENDGVSEWELLVDGEVVNTWTGAGGNNALETISIEADLAQGDEIMLQGLRDSGEFARLDWIDITSQDPVDDTPVPVDDAPDTPDPNGTLIGMGLTEVETLDLDGFVFEARSSASGGSGIKTLDSGTASGIFSGADGTYMIEVGYFNENDGVSEWELLVDGEVVNTWTGAGGNNALETISIEADLAQGDEIVLQGLRDSGEFARLDWIDVA